MVIALNCISQTHAVTPGDGVGQSQELELMILKCPFQLRLFCDSEKCL